MSAPDGLNVDPTLLELFRAESDAHLPVLSQGLLAMEKGEADDQAIASMMRAAHSIKGAARIVGIEPAVRVAHVMEDCFTAAKENRSILSSDGVDVLLQGVDALQRICSMQPGEEVTEDSLGSLVDQLTAVMKGGLAARPAQKPPAPTQAAEIVPVAPDSEAKLVLPAEFDDSAAEALREQMNEAVAGGSTSISLDFGSVRHVSAMGLALLASAARDMARLDPAPALRPVGATGPLATLLRVSGLDRVLASDESMKA